MTTVQWNQGSLACGSAGPTHPRMNSTQPAPLVTTTNPPPPNNNVTTTQTNRPMQPGEERRYLVASSGPGQSGGRADRLMDNLKTGFNIWESMPKWHVTLKDVLTSPSQTCCTACVCPHWFAYQQRKLLLGFTNEPNSFCLKDSLPRPKGCCSDRYDPPIRGWPATWPMQPEPEVMQAFQPKICCEVCCCLPLAVNANRNLMRHRFHVTDSKEDIGVMAAAACCCICCRNRSSELACLTLMTCLQTQQDGELQYHQKLRRELNAAGTPGYRVWEPVIQAAPEVQVMNDGTGRPYATAQGHIIMTMKPDAQTTAPVQDGSIAPPTEPSSRVG